jgi:CheY-like chemotaxis protein
MKTILVVDDDATFLDLVTTALKDHGYNTATAMSGDDGIASIRETTPDALLLDVKMPGMSGMEFLRKLKLVKPGANIPVIIVTNDASLETMSEGAELGIQSYVLKANESMRTIVETVDRLFKTK